MAPELNSMGAQKMKISERRLTRRASTHVSSEKPARLLDRDDGAISMTAAPEEGRSSRPCASAPRLPGRPNRLSLRASIYRQC
jgi:hypothetical protein